MSIRFQLIISLLICLVLFASGCTVATYAPKGDPDKSVVLILVYKEGTKKNYSGSGFVVAEGGYIITNDHVIEPYYKTPGYKIFAFTEGTKSKQYPLKLIWSSANLDMALLRAEKFDAPAITINTGSLKKESSVIAIGFPAVANAIDAKGTATTISTHTKGEVSRVVRSDWLNRGQHVQTIQHTASINPGNSGGPLINACNQVVGINTLIATKGQSTYFSSHASELAKILRPMNLPVNITNSPCLIKASGASLWWSILVTVLISLVVSTIAIYFFSARMKHALSSATGFILSPEKPASPLEVTQTLHMPAAKLSQYYLENQLSRKQHMLDPQEISLKPFIIGRTSTSDGIQLTDGSVSGQHARLSASAYEPFQFYLEDLKSRNGTFINGKPLVGIRKLSHEDQLQFGAEVFYFFSSTGKAGQIEKGRQAEGWLLKGELPHSKELIVIEVSEEKLRGHRNGMVIGRNPKTVNVIVDHPTVTANGHAKILYSNHQFYISDMGSTNGTKIDARPLMPGPSNKVPLSEDIVVQFGSVKFRVERS